MIRMLSTIATILMLCGTVNAQVSVVQNPSPQSSFVEASAKVEVGQSVTWFISPEPTKQVEIDNIVYFNGPPGVYTVNALVFTVKDNKVTTKKFTQKVTIGEPVPPVPVPVPVPSDPFVKAIQDAFTNEIAADKAVNASKLASIYRMAGKNTVNDATITNTGQLFDTMKTASRTLLPDTAIPGVRKVIGARLNSAFGASVTLDSATRAKLATEFNAIADALSSAK